MSSKDYAKMAENAAYDARNQRLSGNEQLANFYEDTAKMYSIKAANAAIEENAKAMSDIQSEIPEVEQPMDSYSNHSDDSVDRELDIIYKVVDCIKTDENGVTSVQGNPKVWAVEKTITFCRNMAKRVVTEDDEEKFLAMAEMLDNYLEEKEPGYHARKEKELEESLERWRKETEMRDNPSIGLSIILGVGAVGFMALIEFLGSLLGI